MLADLISVAGRFQLGRLGAICHRILEPFVKVPDSTFLSDLGWLLSKEKKEEKNEEKGSEKKEKDFKEFEVEGHERVEVEGGEGRGIPVAAEVPYHDVVFTLEGIHRVQAHKIFLAARYILLYKETCFYQTNCILF